MQKHKYMRLLRLLLPFALPFALQAFAFEKYRNYEISTVVGERVIGEFEGDSSEYIYLKNPYSRNLLQIEKRSITHVQLLTRNAPARGIDGDPDRSGIVAEKTASWETQFSLAGDLALPTGGQAAFLKTGYFARADLSFAPPIAFLRKTPFEWRCGVTGGYGIFTAEGRTFRGKFNAAPVLGFIRLKLDKLRFFLQPYLLVGSGITMTSMTKTFNAGGASESASSRDFTALALVGGEVPLGRYISAFLDGGNYVLFEDPPAVFIKVNFGLGYRF